MSSEPSRPIKSTGRGKIKKYKSPFVEKPGSPSSSCTAHSASAGSDIEENDIGKMQMQLKSVTDERNECKADLEIANIELELFKKRFDKDAKRGKEDLQKVKGELALLQARVYNDTKNDNEDFQKVNGELTDLWARFRHVSEEKEKYKKDLDKSNKDLSELQNKVDKDAKKGKEDLQKVNGELTDLRKRFRHVSEEKEKYKKELDKSNKDLSDLQNKVYDDTKKDNEDLQKVNGELTDLRTRFAHVSGEKDKHMNDLDKANKEISLLTEKMKQLSGQKNQLEKDTELLQANLVEEKFTQELNLANQKLEFTMSELERVQHAYLQLEKDSTIKVSQLQKENDDLEANCRQIIQRLETERKNSEQQINQLLSEKVDLNTRLTNETQIVSDYYAVIEKQKNMIERKSFAEENLNRDIEHFQKDMAVLVGEKIQLRKQIISLEDECKEQQGKIESLQKKIQSLNSNLLSERKHWGLTENRINHKFTVEMNELKESLINALKEKDDLTIRLSKLASASLTHNNPNIADLSNPNRPTKLAEAFSELYDNEWTDAFENLKEEDERIRVDCLLTMLQKAYGFSVRLTDEASKHMGGNFTSLTLNYNKGSNVQPMYKRTPHRAEKRNVDNTELRETSATRLEDKSKTNSSTEYTENVKSECDAIGVKESSLFLKEDSSELNTILKENTQHHELTAEQGFPCFKSETDVLNPDAICAQYDQLHSKDTIPFNKDAALQVGSPEEVDEATVSFDFDILSPTEKQTINDIRKRILHELKDQIIPVIANAVVSAMNLHACDDSITKYVKACASICWEMRIHQPPICLEVLEIDDQTPFNTATYRHYTQSGHRFDYVVWPAMYLFKGGALLSKGVAQGH